MQIIRLLLFVVLSAGCLEPARAQTCEPSVLRHARLIQGEIAGRKPFTAQVSDAWVFSLEPAEYGWDVRVRDAHNMDLTQITPPFHLQPNPRELYGWHFRNAANTGSNTGDVNAPQHLRLFEFSPALTGTGGFRPPQGTPEAREPDPHSGRGALRILDMGLADLEPGEKARMNYLKFDVCLTWPKTKQESIAALNDQSPDYLDEERESMYGCGLDPAQYELFAWVMPRWIVGDLDGDDAIDDIAPIRRKSDGRKGIAICRAGTWLSVIGYGQAELEPLQTSDGEPRTETYFSFAEYLDRVEYWKMDRVDGKNDSLVLGRTEKAELAVFWNGKEFAVELLWVLVEP